MSCAQLQETLRKGRDPNKPCITICAGTGCLAYGTQKLIDNFRQEIEKQKLQGRVQLRTSGCHGFCERGPMVVIHPQKIFYQRMKIDDAPDIIAKTVLRRRDHRPAGLSRPRDEGEDSSMSTTCRSTRSQTRYVFGMNGQIDPTEHRGLSRHRRLLRPWPKRSSGMKPEAVIQEVIKANLRGRGGGGFPTGWKWDSTRKAKGEPKYVICNADEGDPGAYMDRSLLEGNPHVVLEGMIIGAYAIGSSTGLYLRAQ